MKIPTIQIQLCAYADLASNSVVINPREFNYRIYLKVPCSIVAFRPIEIREITDDSCDDLTFVQFSFVQGRPWIDVAVGQLNQKVGYHKYIVRFLTAGDEIVSYYFSYIIQTESPEKPYIYMDRSDSVE